MAFYERSTRILSDFEEESDDGLCERRKFWWRNETFFSEKCERDESFEEHQGKNESESVFPERNSDRSYRWSRTFCCEFEEDEEEEREECLLREKREEERLLRPECLCQSVTQNLAMREPCFKVGLLSSEVEAHLEREGGCSVRAPEPQTSDGRLQRQPRGNTGRKRAEEYQLGALNEREQAMKAAGKGLGVYRQLLFRESQSGEALRKRSETRVGSNEKPITAAHAQGDVRRVNLDVMADDPPVQNPQPEPQPVSIWPTRPPEESSSRSSPSSPTLQHQHQPGDRFLSEKLEGQKSEAVFEKKNLNADQISTPIGQKPKAVRG